MLFDEFRVKTYECKGLYLPEYPGELLEIHLELIVLLLYTLIGFGSVLPTLSLKF